MRSVCLQSQRLVKNALCQPRRPGCDATRFTRQIISLANGRRRTGITRAEPQGKDSPNKPMAGQIPHNPSSEDLKHYRSGEVVEVGDEVEERSEQGFDQKRRPARAIGATAGALVGGAVAAAAGLPIALAGAAVGAVTGAIAGQAVMKEWVRGEDIGSAMDFDQARSNSPKREDPHVISIGGQQPVKGRDDKKEGGSL